MTAELPLPGLEEDKPDHSGHRDRLRTRFLEAPEAVPDYEILELLLFAGVPRKDTKALSKALIERFGSFADALTAAPDELAAFPSVGGAKLTPSAIALFPVVREAARRLAYAPIHKRPVIGAWDQLLDYCRTAMATLPTEQFRLLFLDRKNVLIRDELQQEGTIDHTPVYPREVAARALALKASAVIMVHNHPSGDPTPSRADIDMTRTVRDALAAVGVTLHDHLVVGRKNHVSFKAQGLI